MKYKKNLFYRILGFVVFTLIMGFIATGVMENTFATPSNGEPDVIVTIDANGHISQEGNLFGEDLWYPNEKGRDGIIRIYNNYRETKLTSLGVEVELNKEDYIYQSFLKHMKLTIKKGRWLDFGETSLVNDKSLGDFLRGITLEKNDQLSITSVHPLDLKYTMRMDEEAGNELQNLTAQVSFMIKTPITNTDHDNPKDDEKDKDKDKDDGDEKQVFVEEPLNIIPDIGGHWAHECIIALLENGIIEADKDGNVRPDDYITRAETAMLMAKALKLEPKYNLAPKYVDQIPDWAVGYVNITSEKNIFLGYPGRLFKAENGITREEIIAVLTRAFKLSLDDKNLELPFIDKESIGAWAQESVKAGFEDKVILGYPDNTYRPRNNITRAEAFTIICKLLGYHDIHMYKLQ